MLTASDESQNEKGRRIPKDSEDSRPVERRGRDSNPRYRFTPYTGLANRNSDSATVDQPSTCENAADCVACYVALLERENPDLAAVVKGWNDLPPAVRAGIVAMVTAARRDGAQG